MKDRNLRGYLDNLYGEYTILDENRLHFSEYLKLMSGLFSGLNINVRFVWSKNGFTHFLVIDKRQYLIYDAKLGLYMNALRFPELAEDAGIGDFEELLFSAMTYIASGELLLNGHSQLCAFLNKKYVKNFCYNSPIGILDEMNQITSVLLHEWVHFIEKNSCEKLFENMKIINAVFNDFCDKKVSECRQIGQADRAMWYDSVFRYYFMDKNAKECCADLFGFEHYLMLRDKDEVFRMLTRIDGFVFDSLVAIHQTYMINHIKLVVDSAIKGEEYCFVEKDLYDQRLRITREIYSRRLIAEVGVDRARKTHERFTGYLYKYHQQMLGMLEDLHRIISQNKGVLSQSDRESLENENCFEKYVWPPIDSE